MLWWPPQHLLLIIIMQTDVSSCPFLISAFRLTCSSPFLHTFTSPRSAFIWMFPAPHVLAAVVASSLVSPGIRDLRLARCPVSPLICTQGALCTVNGLDRLTHDPKSVVMGSRGGFNMWLTEFTFVSEAKMQKAFFFFSPPCTRVLQIWVS